MADKNLPDVAKMRTLLAKLPDGEAKDRVAEQIAEIEAESAATPPPAPEPEVEIADVEVEVKEEKPKRGRKPRAKAEPKAKPQKASRFVFEKPVDGGKEVKVVEAMTEAEAKEAMDGTDFEFVKQITRGRSPREGFVADKKAPAKKKEVEKPKSKPRASKKERVEMAKAAGMSETRAERISEKVATGKKRGRKPMDKEAWLFEMPLKTQAGKVKRKIVEATSEKAAIKSAGSSYKLVRKLSEGESPKVGTMEMEGYVAPPKRGRGRPKGAKNKVKASAKPSRMPSKKSQAAIEAKSEDIGEGIAIADRYYPDADLDKILSDLLTLQKEIRDASSSAALAYAKLKDFVKFEGKGKKMARGGKTQGYDDKLDESLGMRKGAGRTKEQSRKDRRDESAGMEKSMGRRKYASVGTMDKGRRKMAFGGVVPNSVRNELRKEGFDIVSVDNMGEEEIGYTLDGEPRMSTIYGVRIKFRDGDIAGRDEQFVRDVMENADGDVLWITTFGDSMDFEITQEDDYYAKGGTTEGKPKVESLEEVFLLMDGTDIAYDDMGDAEKMFGGDPLTHKNWWTNLPLTMIFM